MIRAKPKKKKQKVTMTSKQVMELKRETTKEAVDKATLLVLLATADEIGLTEDQIGDIAVRIDRYAEHVDSKLVDLRKVKELIEKQTGLKFKGW